MAGIINKDDVISGAALTNVEELNSLLAETLKLFTEIAKEVPKIQSAFKNVKSMDEYTAAQKRKSDADAKMLVAEQKAAQIRQKMQIEAEKQAKIIEKQAKENEKLNSSYQKLIKSHSEAVKKAKELAASMGLTNKATQQAIKEANKYGKELEKIDKALNFHQRNVGNYKSALTSLGGTLKSTILQFAGIYSIVEVVNKVFGTTLAIDKYQMTLQQLRKTQFAVQQDLNFLTQTANKAGTEILSLTDSYIHFAGAAKGTGITVQQTKDLFEAVSIASTKMGMSAFATEGALKALSQMLGKNQIMAEELRGQLAEHMPMAQKLFADALGVSVEKLNIMMKEGKLLAVDVLPKFGEQLRKEFGIDSTTKVETATSAISRFKNALTELIDSLQASGVIKSFFEGLANFVRGLNYLISSNSDAQKEFNEYIKQGDELLKNNEAIEKRGENMRNMNASQLKEYRATIQDQIDLEEQYLKAYDDILVKKVHSDERYKKASEALVSKTPFGKERAKAMIDQVWDEARAELKVDKEKHKQKIKLLGRYLNNVDYLLRTRPPELTEKEKNEVIDRHKKMYGELEKIILKYVYRATDLYKLKTKIMIDELAKERAANEAFYNQWMYNNSQAFLNGEKNQKQYSDESIEIEKARLQKIIDSDAYELKEKQTASEQLAQIKINEYNAEMELQNKAQDAADVIREENNKELEDEEGRKKKGLLLLADFTTSLVDSVQEYQRQSRQNELAIIESNYNREIEMAGNNEKKKAEIQKKYEGLLRRKRYEDALATKREGIFKATVNTAVGVTKALSEQNYVAAVAIGILGAIEVATIASQEIPKYAKGVKNAKGGISEVAEQGMEIVESPKGEKKLYTKPSIIDLEKGSNVYTNEETKKMLSQNAMRYSLMEVNKNNGIDLTSLEEKMDKLIDIEKNKTQPYINFDRNGFVEGYRKNDIFVKNFNRSFKF